MSILKKPYEIAVYDDILNGDTFEEVRLGVIGSDKMVAQCRALEPNLVRNVNGQNKFSFKMYKHYVDTMTGEKVENPFIGWLVSERKIKLKYGKTVDGKDRWYDFIIKDINENSSNYLYTYQLEDALVQELSKNGFGKALDAKLNNNIGTAKELADFVLSETGWTVESEALVQKVDEALIYVTFPYGTVVTQLLDQTELSEGVKEEPNVSLTKPSDAADSARGTALAFYSCCTGKPHRFQFIYLGDGEVEDYAKNAVSVDDERHINIANCQYYIEVNKPDDQNDGYQKSGSYYLPAGWSVVDMGQVGVGDSFDTTISSWYRGYRYGFAQQAEYISLLDRYCQKYKHGDNDVYGFSNNQYNSPTIMKNMITNTEFKGTAGWTATYFGSSGGLASSYAPKIEPVYGKFKDGKFYSVIDELQNNRYSEDEKYLSLLKFEPKSTPIGYDTVLINSGFYDNRTLIGSVDYDEEWILKVELLNSTGATISDPFDIFNFQLVNVIYDVKGGYHKKGLIWASLCSSSGKSGIIKFNSKELVSSDYADVKVSEEDFKKKDIKLVITPKSTISSGGKPVYYIKNIQLYKKVIGKNGEPMAPDAIETEGTIVHQTAFFDKEDLLAANTKEKLVLTNVTDLDYSVYKPVYNSQAQKTRAVTAKESNYFNILQSIAETFEAWMSLEVARDENTGAIISKKVCYKNYAGNDNYAAFRYGVNLKDITRTYTSKNIATKLIVKQNSNEYAENGFCTIARSNANPTGENYIYDFQYYDKMGLMNTDDYFNLIYADSGMIGPDLEGQSAAQDYNLKGYFPRLKNLNEKIIDKSEEIAQLSTDLVTLEAEKAVAEATVAAAQSSLVEVNEDFETLTGFLPDHISEDDYATISCELPTASVSKIKIVGSSTYVAEKMNVLNDGNDWAQDAEISMAQVPADDPNSRNFNFYISLQDKTPTEINAGWEVDTHGDRGYKPSWESGILTKSMAWQGLKIVPSESTSVLYVAETKYQLSYKLTLKSGTLKTVGGHCDSFAGHAIKVEKIETSDGKETSTLLATTNLSYVELPTPDTTVGSKYKITVTGTYKEEGDTRFLFIQPNRSIDNLEVECEISDIKLYKYTGNVATGDRTFRFQPLFELIPYSEKRKNLISNFDYSHKKTSGDASCTEESLYLIPQQDLSKLVGKSLTLSYKLIRDSVENTTNPAAPSWGQNRFGIHGCAVWQTSDGLSSTVTYPFASKLEALTPTDTQDGTECRIIMTETLSAPTGYPNLRSLRFAVQPFAIPQNEAEWEISEPQLEFTPENGISGNYEAPAPATDGVKYLTPTLTCSIPAGATAGTTNYTLTIVDLDNPKITELLTSFATYQEELFKANKKLNTETEVGGVVVNKGLAEVIDDKKTLIRAKEDQLEALKGHKSKLNQKFFKLYSRFIQEGTWIDEEYTEDDKYYADAQTVLYNSCYPQVVYQINVLELSRLPGYELFTFELGDKTYAEDPEFFGNEGREEVIISQISEVLDDPSKNQILVQNFKNQFQDLFQKITATVQQTQYSTGAYEKAVGLAEASDKKKGEFVNAALGLADAKFSAAGQTSVRQDIDGITLTDENTKDEMRLIGGAILMSTTDKKTGVKSWKTGLTPEGISASLVTAGTINTGNILITNGSDPVFRWDTFGLSAFDTDWSGGQIVSKANPYKFVRFDKYGIYGINGVASDNTSVNGEAWKPNDINDIDAKATFALTWEGLKITGNDGVVARLGKIGDNILSITKTYKDVEDTDGDNNKEEIITEELMTFSNDGTLMVGGWKVSQSGFENDGLPESVGAMKSSESTPEVFLAALPKTRSIEKWETGQNDNIVFKAGKNFMVSVDGTLYANQGYIGGLKIAEVQDTINRQAMSCAITSSAGTNFSADQLSNEEATTTLEAFVYKGANEFTPEGGRQLEYTWFYIDEDNKAQKLIDSSTNMQYAGKSITVKISQIAGKSIFFDASDGGDSSILNLARLGFMSLGKE